MLISHRKKFIFTKTVKTAGTSVESYFEQYCMHDGEWQISHSREQYVSDAGVIGCRAGNPGGSDWYNHMSAYNIRNLIGQDVWNRYFKFTVVRNPFDKMVSGFFMFRRPESNAMEIELFRTWIKHVSKLIKDNQALVDAVDVPHYLKPIECSLVDRDKYLIDGVECVDFFIQFENLNEGLMQVCDRLSVPFDLSRIPEFKKGIRHHNVPVRKYFDHESEMLIRDLYAWEIDRFHYDFPEY